MTFPKYIYTSISTRVSSAGSTLRRVFAMFGVVMLMLCAGSVEVSAQKLKLFQEDPDSVPLFRGVAVSADLFGAVQRMVSDYGQYEAALRVNLKDKYFPVFELGLGDAKHTEDAVTGISTETTAPYGRIGCDFNVSKNKHDDYRVYIGARYAFTSFDVSISHPGVKDPVYGGTAEYSIKDETCNCHWVEALFGVDAKIFGPVRLGWSVRYRQRLKQKMSSMGEPWYTPGYGRSGKNNIGGTFNLIFEI